MHKHGFFTEGFGKPKGFPEWNPQGGLCSTEENRLSPADKQAQICLASVYQLEIPISSYAEALFNYAVFPDDPACNQQESVAADEDQHRDGPALGAVEDLAKEYGADSCQKIT